ncbi:MAG: hypothetical protein ACPG4Z_06695 [Chitinophagales bacterium]
MLKNKILSIIALLILLSTSCTKPPNDGIPAYIQIDSVSLNVEDDEGTAIHGISDLWIESEGENVGVHEYPKIVPALISGERDVVINAGIMVSGDPLLREIYPFLKPYNTTLTFTPQDTTIISPVFEYKDGLTFVLNETFESSNIFSGMTRTDANDSENIEGRAGTLYVDEDTPLAEATTATFIDIPEDSQVYLEVSFKGEHSFEMGIEGFNNGASTGATFLTSFYPNDEWQKIYFDLTNLTFNLNAEEFNFFFSLQKSNSVTDANVYVDNIKIIYR